MPPLFSSLITSPTSAQRCGSSRRAHTWVTRVDRKATGGRFIVPFLWRGQPRDGQLKDRSGSPAAYLAKSGAGTGQNRLVVELLTRSVRIDVGQRSSLTTEQEQYVLTGKREEYTCYGSLLELYILQFYN
jgi:hypothetical protein